jgi:hypothetical protein
MASIETTVISEAKLLVTSEMPLASAISLASSGSSLLHFLLAVGGSSCTLQRFQNLCLPLQAMVRLYIGKFENKIEKFIKAAINHPNVHNTVHYL